MRTIVHNITLQILSQDYNIASHSHRKKSCIQTFSPFFFSTRFCLNCDCRKERYTRVALYIWDSSTKTNIKTCILNASIAPSGVAKRWPLILFLRTGIKRSHSVASQDYTADDSSNPCFECSKMQLFEPMCESLYCRGEEWCVFDRWFSWFLGRQLANKWLCTIQNWLFCVVLVVRLQLVQFSEKNRPSFAWKCLVPEQLLLDLAHLETVRNTTSIFEAFLSTNRYEPFFERLTNCVGSNANKFFWQTNVYAILNVRWSH